MLKLLLIFSLLIINYYSVQAEEYYCGQILKDTAQIEYDSLYINGTKYKLLGNTNLAIVCFYRCLELNPNKSGPYYQLAEIYSSINDIKKALLFSQKAYQIEKNNQWYILQLSKLYQSVGNIDSTLFLYEKLVNLEPYKEEYYLNLAFLYFKKGKSSKSIKLLSNFLDNNYMSEEIALSLYQIYKFRKDDNNALKILKAANTKFPEETRFYGLIAEHYLSIKQMDSAYLYYKKLLEIDPLNDKGILSLMDFYRANSDSTEFIALAKKFVANSDFNITEKIEILRFLIKDKKYIFKYQEDIDEMFIYLLKYNSENLNLYFLRSNFYLIIENLQKAKETLQYIIDNFSVNYTIWEQFLYVLNSLKSYNELMQYSIQVINKFPEKPIPYLFCGVSNYYMENYENSVLYLNRGLSYCNESKDLLIQFYSYLGESYQSLKKYEKSEFYFENVIKMDPQNYLVLNNYSYYLSLRNTKLEEALKYSKLCVDAFPNSSTYLDTYGWILFKSGNISDAKKYIEKALLNIGNENVEIIEHYCEILFYSGDLENAVKYYKILEERGKSNLILKNLLKIE